MDSDKISFGLSTLKRQKGLATRNAPISLDKVSVLGYKELELPKLNNSLNDFERLSLAILSQILKLRF
jgi:hypothetical protein